MSTKKRYIVKKVPPRRSPDPAQLYRDDPYARKDFRKHLLTEVEDVEGGQFPTGGAPIGRRTKSQPSRKSKRSANSNFSRSATFR